MTPNHDHDSLFVAPHPPTGDEAADNPLSTVDDGDEAMRRLRDPFAVRTRPERPRSSIPPGPAAG